MKVVFITNCFPYLPGEQFIESEIKFWEKTRFEEIYLLPSNATGEARPTPQNILVDTSLSAKNLPRFIQRFFTLFSIHFYRELISLFKFNKYSLRDVWGLFNASIEFCNANYKLSKWLRKNGPVDLVYTYWNSYYSYAACEAKEKGLVSKVVSRIHRYDLYEDQVRSNYFPFKRHYLNKLNHLYVLSKEAEEYCKTHYNVHPSKILISPLGVSIPSCICKASSNGEFRVISVSSFTKVKRIDKIIKSLSVFAVDNPGLNVFWLHAGDGPLKDSMNNLARGILTHQKNVSFCFLGQITNHEIKQLYRNEQFDVFVNSSESEGIPVSIMEAMAAGVPAIAPNVGGISELVDNKCGFLLSPEPDIAEFVNSYCEILATKSKNNYRAKARLQVLNNYSARANYIAFISSLEQQFET